MKKHGSLRAGGTLGNQVRRYLPRRWRDLAQSQIIDNRSSYIWTIWRYRFVPKQSGTVLMRVRATDGNGASQLPQDHQLGEGISSQARMTLKVSL